MMSFFWDFEPSWQNSVEAIERNLEDFIVIGAFSRKKMVGYCIIEPTSGDITQIAVDKNHRRMGVATELLQPAFKLDLYPSIQFINAEKCPVHQ